MKVTVRGDAHGIAAGVALAVVVQVHVPAQIVLVAADGALVPVIAGIIFHGAAVVWASWVVSAPQSVHFFQWEEASDV